MTGQEEVYKRDQNPTLFKSNELISCKPDGCSTCVYPTGKEERISFNKLKHDEALLASHWIIQVYFANLINLYFAKNYCHQGEISLSEENCCSLENRQDDARVIPCLCFYPG